MDTHIEPPDGGMILFQGMQTHTAESIKSLEGYDIAWVEEAQTLSARSLTLLRPTIRTADSELWFSWNPRLSTDPVDALLRGPHRPDDVIVLGSTYRDNPWFEKLGGAERHLGRLFPAAHEEFRHHAGRPRGRH
jgi:phage terminase large subunit